MFRSWFSVAGRIWIASLLCLTAIDAKECELLIAGVDADVNADYVVIIDQALKKIPLPGRPPHPRYQQQRPPGSPLYSVKTDLVFANGERLGFRGRHLDHRIAKRMAARDYYKALIERYPEVQQFEAQREKSRPSAETVVDEESWDGTRVALELPRSLPNPARVKRLWLAKKAKLAVVELTRAAQPGPEIEAWRELMQARSGYRILTLFSVRRAVSAKDFIGLTFPGDVVRDLKLIAPVVAEWKPKLGTPVDHAGPVERYRKDRTGLRVFTLDAVGANDLDDGLSWGQLPDRPLPSGHAWLGIHIVDMTVFTEPGSPEDLIARQRGRTLYARQFIRPIYSPEMTYRRASLLPGMRRRVWSFFYHVDADLKVLDRFVELSVVQSKDRYTPYVFQRMALEQIRLRQDSVPVKLWLTAEKLRRERMVHGRLSHGQTGANEMVEEYMVLANLTAAQILRGRGVASIHRVNRVSPDLIRVMTDAAGPGQSSDYEGFLDANFGDRELTTLLSKAKYAVHHPGHDGLGVEDFCHVTSPIRRYPDVLVQRQLKYALGYAGFHYTHGELAAIADEINTANEIAESEGGALGRFDLLVRHLEDTSPVSGRIRLIASRVHVHIGNRPHRDFLVDLPEGWRIEGKQLLDILGRVYEVGDELALVPAGYDLNREMPLVTPITR